jgi:TonB-dependent starch-binding outer membrane protein SusC
VKSASKEPIKVIMRSKFLSFLLMMLCSYGLMAQQRVITGNVKGDNGEAMPGVTVTLKGTKIVRITDKSGNFSIPVPPAGAPVLVFSHVGSEKKEVKVGAGASYDVVLKQESSALEDVVVIGYQSIKRKNLLASVSSVGAKDLKDVTINNAAEALNGRLAGVTAITAEGAPDAEVNVKVRGGMSITGENSPMYIIDGVRVENGLANISPQDIQTIDVLKDASATAIYGAAGGNGVVIITTKAGKPGKMRVSLNAFYGWKSLPKTLEVMSPYEFVTYQSERSRGSSSDSTSFLSNFGTTWDTLANYKNVKPVNWQDQVMGLVGRITTENLSLSGGNKKGSYNVGYTYNWEKPIVQQSNYQRHLVSAKGDYKITKKLKVGINGRYSFQDVIGAGVSDDKGASYNRLRNSVKYKPFLQFHDVNGKLVQESIDDAESLVDPNTGNGLYLINPIILAKSEFRRKTTETSNLTANASYAITKNMTFKTTIGVDNKKYTNRMFSDSTTPYSINQGSKKPIVQLDTTTTTSITNSNVLTYSLKGIRNKHDFDFLVGEESYDLRIKSQNDLVKLYPQGINKDSAFKFTSLGTAFTAYPKLRKTRGTVLSFFSRINYAFKDKYLFTFNMRADGSSRFASSGRWSFFPAASVAWRAKNEKFLEDVKWLNDLKIRIGYGQAGNNKVDEYQYLTTFSSSNYYYGINGQAVPGYNVAQLANTLLTWESTVNKNIGLDFTILKNRLDVTVDYYNNHSNKLLLFAPVAPEFGFNQQFQNVGKTHNRGVELQLNARLIKAKNNFTWNATFNISTNKNTIEAVGTGQNSFLSSSTWSPSGISDYIQQIGSPVGSMYGLKTDGFYTVNDFDYNYATGIYTLRKGVVTDVDVIGTVTPGSIKFKDVNGDGKVDLTDRTIIGNPTPKFTGGLNQQFTYKQWDASVFVNFSYGNDVYNANKIEFTNGYSNNSNMLKVMEDRWRVVTPDGRTAEWVNGSTVYGVAPAELAALNANAKIWQPLRGNGAFTPNSWAIEDGSFLRLNNVTIGYTLPVRVLTRMHMSRLRVYVTGNNLAVATSYSGYDPEVSVKGGQLTPAVDYSAYPKSRTFIVGLNASF